MRKLSLILFAMMSLTGCRQNDSVTDASTPFEMKSAAAEYITASSLPVTTVSGSITTNTTWSGVIELDGVVTVKNGATLTIRPGTFIKGKINFNYNPNGVLVITKTGRINATGTETQPIIFTSSNLLDGNEDTTARPGDFGGVILLGDAPTNKPSTTVIEGLTGADYQYGGTNAGQNAGILKYVRIEFAGYDLLGPNSGNEINGLSLGGVGHGTTLDHIQVSYSLDDSFEFFGGTVNATNLISFGAQDDNYDFEYGYKGTISCALALADYNSGHSYSQGGSSPDSNGIELDNDGTGSSAFPFTQPILKNFTIIGAKSPLKSGLYENGVHVRRNGKLSLENTVITGYPIGILLETISGASVNLADYSFTNVQSHGFTFATASKIGASSSALNIPGITASTANPAHLWGMAQPFFNESFAWNVSPRNCGDFKGNWTKYDFSIVE
ncbi:hypothetical protein CEY12_03915 [Chryseobacterium sp. T16E-39]|uniref:hypothetical protein n=1 Tax=Chryseobacterium sp. T16E-39 TaxID=2015076 RepID=UPI000B5B187B|nr:hypothetical protein [Chryseobacterium sp. T16E-39]ASK29301.1 hypothetical protein CEY12_03915 [Chryseobacterium sp. T16E-39]